MNVGKLKESIALPFCFYVCRGMNAMHVLGQYGRENAGALFDLFIECMPEYPIDKPDQNGNTGTSANCMLSDSWD